MEISTTTKWEEREMNYINFARFLYLTMVLKVAYVFCRLINIYRRFGQAFNLHLQVLRRTKPTESGNA